jgi:hypothetical protein
MVTASRINVHLHIAGGLMLILSMRAWKYLKGPGVFSLDSLSSSPRGSQSSEAGSSEEMSHRSRKLSARGVKGWISISSTNGNMKSTPGGNGTVLVTI